MAELQYLPAAEQLPAISSASVPTMQKQRHASTPEPASAELDELFTLLRADSTTSKQRAIAIIEQQQAEDLYLFMQQLLQHTGKHGPCSKVQCDSAYPQLDVTYEAPDSPKRQPATDQMLSPCRTFTCGNSSTGLGTLSEEDPQLPDSPMLQLPESSVQQLPDSPVLQLPDSPVQHLKADSGLHQLLQQPRRRFLAESLDLNLGASFDLLSKASLADFSSAAAASRMSTTALVRQSHMRVLSPVAEASFMSAADAQQELSMDSSLPALELPAGRHQDMYSSSNQQHQLDDAYPISEHPSGLQADEAGDMSPSTCSSPRDPSEGVGTTAAVAALRMSVAESAHDWPNSQPLPYVAQEADSEALAEASAPVAYPFACLQPAAAAAAAALARPSAAEFRPQAVTPVGATPPALSQQQHNVLSTPSSANAANAGSSRPASNSSTPKRTGGPTPLGIITAPIHGANALRRSITRLWGGNKGASKAKAPATAASPSKQAPRSLACASAPIASVYGGVSSSRLPSFRQNPSPAVRQPMQGFGVTQQGSSPTKAAAAAVAASSVNSKRVAGAAAAATTAARTPQRPGASIGYKPPSSAGRGTPTGAVGSPLGSYGSATTPGSRIPAGSGGSSSSGYTRAGSAGPSSRQLAAMQQHQQRTQHGHDRPSSQASNVSYARSDVSLTGTGSHTSAGPFQGGFQATRQALQGKATPTLKQPASRMQYKQQQVPRAGTSTAAAAAAASQASSRGTRQLGTPSSIPGFQQGGQGFSRQGKAAAGQQQGSTGGGSSSGSRIGGGGRSQLRRSRSCGSLAEMLNVAELRSMWKQREHDVTTQQQSAAARQQQHSTVGAQQGQSSIGHGTSSRHLQQPAARPGSYQPPSRLPAAGAAADEDSGLPVLSRCQSPTRQDRAQGVGTSQVLAEMGHVLSHMNTLIAGDAGSKAAAVPGQAAVCTSGGSWGSWANGSDPRQHAGALGSGQSPSALVYKLVKGAGASTAAATPAAADRRAVRTQQMLRTPPSHIPGVSGVAGSHSTRQGGLRGGADDVNPVSSRDDSLAVSGSSSQVGTTADLTRGLTALWSN